MGKMKAVVLEKSGSHYTVLGENGTFRKIHSRLNAEVGEEIEIKKGLEGFKGLRVWAGAAALFLLVLTSLLGWNLYQAPTAVALLSVDINPSLQFTLDAQGNLIKFQTQDEDAKHMLSQIDFTGKPIDEVLEQVVTLAFEQNYLNAEQGLVMVGYSPLSNKVSEQMPKVLNKDHIKAWVSETVAKKGLTPKVEVFTLTSQEREHAQKLDLTLGEYALWQTAQKAGVETQPKKMKELSERVRLLENPQVQAKVEADKQWLESSLLRTQETSEKDSGSKAKPNEEGALKSMPKELPASRIKDLNQMNKQSRGKVSKEYRAPRANKRPDSLPRKPGTSEGDFGLKFKLNEKSTPKELSSFRIKS